MCEFTGYTNQIGLSLYPTAGTSRDWSYGALRTIVYTFEHNQDFHPPYAANIPSTYAINRPAWLLLAEAWLRHARISGDAADLVTAEAAASKAEALGAARRLLPDLSRAHGGGQREEIALAGEDDHADRDDDEGSQGAKHAAHT